MKQTIYKGLILLLLGAVLVGTPSVIAKSAKKTPAKAKTAAPKWGTSYKDALTQAKKTGKPILIDFNATWCGPCHMMEDEVFKTAGFAAEAKKWVLLNVDVDKHPDLAQHYNASSLPLLVTLSPKGKTISSQAGYGGYDYVMDWVKSSYKKAKK